MQQKSTPFLLGVIIVLLLVLGVFIITNHPKTSDSNQTTGVSGTFDINGVIPQGATLTLASRIADTKTSFASFQTGIVPKDQGTWAYQNAVSGKDYEIQATVYKGNTIIAQSDPHPVTAPASGEVLVINIQNDNATGTAVISGNVAVSGYIPAGATITVQGRVSGTTDFSNVATNLPASPRQFMSYTTAEAGRSYDVQGILNDQNGQQIGISPIIVIAAPAKDELLTINSTAKPPVTPAPTAQPTATVTPTPKNTAVSGTINFNGQALSNSRIVIFQRPSGSSQYQVAVNNVSPKDGSKWSWSGATTGSLYNIVAVLKQKQSDGTDKDISTSNTLTVAAPATSQILTINSGFVLPPASGSITVSCGNYNASNNTWGAAVSFQSINQAQEYWFQIGTTDGGVELTNTTQNSTNNPTQSFAVTLKNNTTYYARYAYANVQNIHAYDSQFSPFSGTTPLRCSQ